MSASKPTPTALMKGTPVDQAAIHHPDPAPADGGDGGCQIVATDPEGEGEIVAGAGGQQAEGPLAAEAGQGRLVHRAVAPQHQHPGVARERLDQPGGVTGGTRCRGGCDRAPRHLAGAAPPPVRCAPAPDRLRD